MKKRNRIFAALLAAAMMVAGASTVMAAGKEFDLSKVEDTTYTADVTIGDFTLVANSEKNITIETKEEVMVAEDGKEFTKRMNFGGGANQIKFTASKGEKVVVYVLSTGSEREVGLFTPTTVDAATGKNTALATGKIPAKDQPIGAVTFEVPEDGEYYIATVSSGMRVYYLSVGDVTAAPKQDSVPKTGVVSVVAICGVVALAGAGVAVVTGKKKEN